MRGLSRKLCIAALAGLLGACAHDIKKAEIPPTTAPADEISRMDADINEGYKQQYDVLDNKNFAKSQKYLDKAKRDMAKGKSQQDILDDLGYARAYLQRTHDVSEGRREMVSGILDARRSAIENGAKNFPKERRNIGKADDELRKVSDDIKISSDKFNKIQNAYLDIELGAIQDTQLGNAQAAVTAARHNGAESNVPGTLREADVDLTNAYNQIAANRHNPDGYRDAVEKANAQAQLLVEVLATSKRGNKTLPEDVALDMVKQNRQLRSVSGELHQTREHAAMLGKQVSEQERQLSDAEAQQKLNQAFEEARKEFGKNEAEVYRQGDKLLIRLKAMNFPSGKSDLPSDSLSLLSKVKGIAEELNPQQVVVEGHTDSTGSAQINQQLSQDRAKAVANYFESNGMEGEVIQAVGQGYQEPIASNKTKAGRAKNRRVDVIITPSNTAKSSDQQQQDPSKL
jgi:OOP family OmpA-OmpF porin